jgi:hypothetical protein
MCFMEAMAIPIKSDKVETWKSWCGELTGPRKAEFDDMNQRLGLTTHAAFHQANPDGSNLAVVVIDGPGAETFLGKMAASENEFDQWFRTSIEDIHPMDFSAPAPPMPTRQL